MKYCQYDKKHQRINMTQVAITYPKKHNYAPVTKHDRQNFRTEIEI